MTTKPEQLEAGMTYVEILDFRAQEHKHQMERERLAEVESSKRAKYELREARQETWRWVAVTLGAIIVILGIVAAIVYGTTRPTTGADVEERREIACVSNGGGYVPEDMLVDTADHGVCIYPGKR